jgi:hypothetical protein
LVYLDNQKYAWFDLNGAPQSHIIPTRIGPVRLEIGSGYARVLESPCPNKICVKTGTIRHGHEEVVCMPAHLLVVIEGDASLDAKKNGSPDAVTY